jgi:hypothetical protein
MRTDYDSYEYFKLADERYVARMARKLASGAALKSRHRNRGPRDTDDGFGEYDDDYYRDSGDDFDYTVFDDYDRGNWDED